MQTLTDREVEILGRLLRGETVRGPKRAAIHVVRVGLAVWMQGAKALELTPHGKRVAMEYWPGVPVAEKPPVELEFSPQLALDLPPSGPPIEGLIALLHDFPPAEEIAGILATHFPHGRGLPQSTQFALEEIGIPPAAAQRIVAAFALARACHTAAHRGGEPIFTTKQMAALIYDTQNVAHQETELFWVVSLDYDARVLNIDKVAKGRGNVAEIRLADVFAPVIRTRAHACFVAHNHPAGSLDWSDEDIILTQCLIDLAKRLEIKLLDHLILAPDGSYASVRPVLKPDVADIDPVTPRVPLRRHG